MPLSIAVAEASLWTALVLWCANWLRLELTQQGGVPEPCLLYTSDAADEN